MKSFILSQMNYRKLFYLKATFFEGGGGEGDMRGGVKIAKTGLCSSLMLPFGTIETLVIIYNDI